MDWCSGSGRISWPNLHNKKHHEDSQVDVIGEYSSLILHIFPLSVENKLYYLSYNIITWFMFTQFSIWPHHLVWVFTFTLSLVLTLWDGEHLLIPQRSVAFRWGVWRVLTTDGPFPASDTIWTWTLYTLSGWRASMINDCWSWKNEKHETRIKWPFQCHLFFLVCSCSHSIMTALLLILGWSWTALF